MWDVQSNAEGNFHGPTLVLLLDQQAVGRGFEGPEVARTEQPQEGKCMYIKKWILAQIAALTQLQVSMFFPDKSHYFSTENNGKTQPYEGFEGCWPFQQVEMRT